LYEGAWNLVGQARKEGKKKGRTSQLPQDKSKTLKKNQIPQKKNKTQKNKPPPPPPPPLFIYHNLLVDEIKWDSTEPRNNF
jgi:hypothetical protein